MCTLCPSCAQVPRDEPTIADDAPPADEAIADKEPADAAVEDDAARADKEKKEKQHAEIVAKRQKAALAKKKREWPPFEPKARPRPASNPSATASLPRVRTALCQARRRRR